MSTLTQLEEDLTAAENELISAYKEVNRLIEVRLNEAILNYNGIVEAIDEKIGLSLGMLDQVETFPVPERRASELEGVTQ
jgi:hypothetical protein